MAKKNFETITNPAELYISQPAKEEAGKEGTKGKQEKKATATKKAPSKAPAPKKTATKKPTSPKKQEPVKVDPGEVPAGYKLNPAFIETKSQRLNLLVQPSVYKRLKKLATKKKQTVNGLINQIIIEKLESEDF